LIKKEINNMADNELISQLPIAIAALDDNVLFPSYNTVETGEHTRKNLLGAMSNYVSVTKTYNGLDTTDKTLVGAINEVLGYLPTADQKLALNNANSPTALNPFATIADLVVSAEKTENLPILSAGQTAFSLTKGTPVSDDSFHIFYNGVQVSTYTRVGINVTWTGAALRVSPDPANPTIDSLVAVFNRIESSTPVKSVFGRYGDILAQSGDYTKAQVGLGDVDDTSDANKPISTLQQNALDTKKNKYTSGSTNDTCGTITLTGSGSYVVNTTAITANSVILLTVQQAGGNSGLVRVSTRVVVTRFTIISNGGDTSKIGWTLIEPNAS
jgi:hypothetical protein